MPPQPPEFSKQAPGPTRTEPAARAAQPRVERPMHPVHQLQRQVGNQAVLALLRSGALQAKLAVGAPDEPAEQEADEVAERVMRKPAVPAAAGGCSTNCGECEECTSQQGGTNANSTHALHRHPIRRSANDAAHTTPDAPESVHQTLDRSGQPLDTATRADMESRFGASFAGVRIHTDPQAAESARSVDALAYTAGDHIVFGQGQYAPHSNTGGKLLAHELTHVVQQRGASSVLRRQPQPQAPAAAPPSGVGLSVSLEGLSFSVPSGSVYAAGRHTPQLLKVVLMRLLGPAYQPGLEREVESVLDKAKQAREGDFGKPGVAKAGEPMANILIRLPAAVILLDLLASKKLETVLTDEQKELLRLGVGSAFLWREFKESTQGELPAWYTFGLFEQEITSHGKLLRAYTEALGEEDPAAARLKKLEVLSDLVPALLGPAQVMEAIRVDVALAADPKAGGAYAALWDLPAKEKPPLKQPPRNIRNLNTAGLFLAYQRTQAHLALNAEVDADARRELLHRFGGFAEREMFSPSEADQKLSDQPATANAPAFPSTLTAVPAVPPPLYNAALGTDHRFAMQVEFPSVYEALGNYAFAWERVRIPDEKIGAPVDVTKLKGESVSAGEVASVRFNRATAYAEADIRRTLEDMKSDLGSPGAGALELIGANAILRYVGTGIRLALDLLTLPRDQKLVTFPETGLYMVRAAMSQVRDEDAAVVRAPSVAYYPVLARDPDEMALAGAKAEATAHERADQRIKELEAKAAALTPEEKEELQALKAARAPITERLEANRAKAAELEAAIASGKQEGDPEAATKQRETLEKIIALRGKRKLDGAEPLTARFVSDLGQTLSLTLEVADRPAGKGSFKVYVSDITTPKSGDATGVGHSHDEAVVNAVRDLLESIHGYGRGRVAIALPSGARTLRIEAGRGALLMEAIENVGTALSVAAVAAAPFTGGASLAFLVPLGLVGAIPSAYRVVQRLEAGTFEFDLENALDLLNVAGSLVGLGRLSAGALRSVRVGRALLVVGFGIDAANGVLMGAQLLQQIDELQKLPPGERSSALMLLLGQTLMSAGVVVGGALAERAQQAHAEAKAAKATAEATTKSITDEAPRHGAPDTAHAPVSDSGTDRFEHARVDNEVSQLGKMDSESEAHIRNDEALRQALLDEPLAAAALKKCASPCFPPEMTPEQVKRLGEFLSRLSETGGRPYDQAALKEYLYARRDKLDEAIRNISGTKNTADFNAWLEYYNHGKGTITPLPAKGDPAELRARIDRAHDTGVNQGRAAAVADGMRNAGFDNPFERQGRYGQGFDDILLKGADLDRGDIYIVEYKGGESQLSEGQMSLEWVVGNIDRLANEGGNNGQDWARTLKKALREGRLKGVVFYTPMEGNAPKPTRRVDFGTYKATGGVPKP